MTTLTVPDLPMTAEDFADMPSVRGLRIELNDGMLEVAASAQMAWHSETVWRIVSLLRRDGRVVVAEFGVVLSSRKVRIPDVTRMRTGVVVGPYDSQIPVASADLLVEVVSPESRQREYEIKPAEYRAAGVPEMWIVTPHELPGEDWPDALVTVHRFDGDSAPTTHLLRDLEI
jgi:Uma2 family endonuclease